MYLAFQSQVLILLHLTTTIPVGSFPQRLRTTELPPLPFHCLYHCHSSSLPCWSHILYFSTSPFLCIFRSQAHEWGAVIWHREISHGTELCCSCFGAEVKVHMCSWSPPCNTGRGSWDEELGGKFTCEWGCWGQQTKHSFIIQKGLQCFFVTIFMVSLPSALTVFPSHRHFLPLFCYQCLVRLYPAWLIWLQICYGRLMPFLVLPWFHLFKPHTNDELLLK